MSIPPIFVHAAKIGWQWQWNQLMNGLAPCDKNGNYSRPISQKQKAIVLSSKDLTNRASDQLPTLIIGRSCPWAHRTWLVYKMRKLENTMKLLLAKADHSKGLWKIEPSFMSCNSLIEIYKLCNSPPNHRATVPALIDPRRSNNQKPQLLGNESAQLVEVLNEWPTNNKAPNLEPEELQEEIEQWQNMIQFGVNDGVYRCGFARNQNAYNKASEELFKSLTKVEESLSEKGPWLCGSTLTLADIRLFPTLVRWEAIYQPLFGCSEQPLWLFPNLCNWRKRFFELEHVQDTCHVESWRNDYFGALFPLRPSSIIPNGPDIATIINGIQPI